jgi:uncharacterized repeat protein (TIGR03803 family)
MRHAIRRIALFFCFGLSLAVLSCVAEAQSLTVLHNFTDGADGSGPFAGITFDQQGRIYGTTPSGGSYQDGTVYRLAREGEGWVLSPLYSFGSQGNDGNYPYARVVFGPDGLLYGTTIHGGAEGYGTVFSLQPPATACKAALCPWVETVIHSFTLADGAYPGYGDLTFDQAGNIYGTTIDSSGSGGVVFKLTRSGRAWTESVLWSFTGGSDGSNPVSGVIFDSAGNLYGTTSSGGSDFNGTVYELSPTPSGWSETTLHSFDTCCGDGGLIWDAHGNLFGIAGVPYGEGEGPSAAYELTPQNGVWSFTQLQDFGDQLDGPISSPTFDSQGNLYGPLPSGGNGFGQIFKLTPSGNQWLYTSFYQFESSCINGSLCYPVGAVTFDASGNMYGTTAYGGAEDGQNCPPGCGTVWEITP